MHNTLESHKFFPIIAWSLVLVFAGFTYFITTQAQAELGEISAGVERLEIELSVIKADKK
jgi:hypothetical protein